MLSFRFDFQKTLQAAALLLREHDNCMSYLRLLKLLYIADRELLAETGRTLTGDRAVAMRNGPVLSHVYDIIKQQSARSGDWDEYIQKSRYLVRLVGNPGTGKLSRGEAAKLTELSDRFRDTDDWALSEETHGFEEWRKNFQEGTSTPIPWGDVLAALGKGELLEAAEKDQAAREVFDSVFGAG